MFGHFRFNLLCAALLVCVAPAGAADLILNEYNAVDSDGFLGSGKSDPFWGQVAGNGGDWFELVVIADHLDMRSWELVVVNRASAPDEESFSIKLSSADVWADMRSGTIVTIAQQLGNNVDEYQPAAGRWWLNVRASATTSGTYATVECISPACDPADANWKVSNNFSQITILDDVGAPVFGPAGEGINPQSGIGSTEVFKLEDTPSAAITAQSTYNDGTSSTFGQPNLYAGGTVLQDFSMLRSVLPYAPMTDVRINEVLSHSGAAEDWVELHNTTIDPIDIGGWFLSDGFGDLTEFEIPAATTIPAGGYVTFDQTTLGFGFSSACGDEVVLSEAIGGVLTGRRDFLEFGAIEEGVTYGRWPNGFGPAARLADATPAAGNAVPALGPVVISEIMYHPLDPGLAATVDPEFVELHNRSPATVTLSTDFGPDGTHPWSLTGGIGFEFAGGQTIAADGYLVVVNFDPVSEPAKLAELQAIYGIDSLVPVLGPYTGALGNSGDTVRLRMPDTPDPDGGLCGATGNPGPFVPRVIVDELTYTDVAPWPTAPDGLGPSLERRNEQAPAANASNWISNTAGGATPGSANTTVGAPTSSQQKCVNALNKDLGRIAKTQGKESCTCIKDATRDRLDGLTAVECLVADRKNRVAKSTAKTASDFGKSCTGNDGDGIPRLSFVGPTDADSLSAAARSPELGIIYDVFGFDLDAAIIPDALDRDGAKCQTSVAKVVKKCMDARFKAFNSCKKSGLKAGAFATATDLSVCITDDRKLKVAKACGAATGKIRSDVDKRCVNKLVNLAAAFPGCAGSTAAQVAQCAQEATACRACIALDLGDDLYRDCDLADDGADNNSCP